MIIWQGFGFVVLVIVFAGLFAGSYIGVTAGIESLYQLGAIAFAVSALPCWPLGRWMNNRPGSRGHSFFFIPVQYWTFIFAAVAVGLVVYERTL